MLRLSLLFRVLGDACSSQVLAFKGLANRLNPTRCSGLSLFLAHPNESDPMSRSEASTISLNHRRNVSFRHRFTSFEPTADSVNPCRNGTCDQCKSRRFVGITPLLTPTIGSRLALSCHFVPFVVEQNQPKTEHR